MDGAGLHARRPRPVADAPAIDAAALAKAWLLTLVADAPLQQVAAVPAADLARSGPALCRAVLDALRSDADLEGLVSSGPEGGAPPAAMAARLTGARTPAAVAAGVEALRAAAWRALRAELRDPVPELIADLGDRLAYVCARVAESALVDRPVDTQRRTGPLAGALAAAASRAAEPAPEAPLVESSPVAPPPAEPPPSMPAEPDEAGGHARQPSIDAPPAGAGGPPPGVHAVDLPALPGDDEALTSLAEELASAPPTGVDGGPPGPVFATGAGGAVVTRVRPVDTSWEASAQSGPPWLASIERRLERRRVDGLPFAVLVAEVDDLDRLMASQTGREVGLALETAERGLTAELAPADLVVRERLGRWWLLSPDRDAGAARDLGERVASAIAGAVLAGAPLSVSIGVAVCPDDGEAVDDLAGRADEGMFAARAAGVPIA
ncbi:MAG TPA: diguanylate cyclase [Baekduia sp.]|nr:diguanylate cyclase [Baekduia sp.]